MIHHPQAMTDRSVIYDDRFGGLGALWPLLGVPATAAAVVVLGRRRRHLLVWSVPFLAALALQPAPWWTRFVLWLPGLGALALAVVLGRLGRAAATGLAALALALVGLPALVQREYIWGRPAATELLERVLHGDRRLVTNNAGTGWVELRPATTVGVEEGTDQFHYLLFGDRLQHRVVPVATSTTTAELAAGDLGVVLTARGSRLDRAAAVPGARNLAELLVLPPVRGFGDAVANVWIVDPAVPIGP